MGRVPEKKTITVNGKSREIETFTWEKLDYVSKIKEVFGLVTAEAVG
jgi:S-adenosylmethionine synthetase